MELAEVSFRELNVAEAEREWYESLLRELQPSEDSPVMVRSVAENVPLLR